MARIQKVETVSTSQLVQMVSKKFEAMLPKRITKDVIQELLKIIEENVVEGRKTRIDRIGILQLKHRAARIGRNPQTREEIRIPPSRKIAFRAAKSLKEQIQGARTRSTARRAPAKKKK